MIVSQPDTRGHFGPYGGRYVPEVLMAPLEELEHAYLAAMKDAEFLAELDDLLANAPARPGTPLGEPGTRQLPRQTHQRILRTFSRAISNSA